MKPDLEYLIWLYSIGVEEILSEVPVNQFGEEHQDDFMGKISKDSISIPTEKFERQKINQVKDKNNSLTKISEEINQLTDVSGLENYFKNLLNKEFDLGIENGLFSTGSRGRSNLIIITETPLIIDFRNGEVYSGKKKSLLEGIIFGMRSSLREKDFGVIMTPVLPLPIGELNDHDHENVEFYHFLYLEKLIKISNPFLVVLIGERSNNLINRLLKIKTEKPNSINIPHFVIPELDYILSVPKAKKDLWDNWKNLIKRERDESFF